MALWDTKTEIQFFHKALKDFASPEQVFYGLESGYYAYVPKGINGENQTLQSRNSLIGQFTEKWAKNLFEPIAHKMGLYAVNNVICDEISLSNRSDADLAFCTTNNSKQSPENIKLIFEIKMSIVSNYTLGQNNKVQYVGDYNAHKGNPSLLRSDSMLKAIGKSINIRVSGYSATKIPIVILGNSPINQHYVKKVDFLKKAGVIQGFWSLNPNPSESDFIKNTPESGFRTFKDENELNNTVQEMASEDLNFFSSMLPKETLGKIITEANKEYDEVKKGEKFLELIRQ